MDYSMNMGLVKVTFFSILIVLSGMAAIASADEAMIVVNMFHGTVTLNGADTPPGTVINAYINEEPRVSFTTEYAGMYYIIVGGNASDNGGIATFEICGATADQTAVWHESYQDPRVLNLTAVDNVSPSVTNANATPQSIIANGADTTQLNVTVVDGCRCTVGNVTVNLSAIGGLDAQKMSRIGDTDVYSVTVNATEGTLPGAHGLPVNASDVFGNCTTSVYIDLAITGVEAPVVSNPDANPASIVANGADTTQLNVTVMADSDIDSATVNLSAIGGLEAKEMSRIGDTDVYSVTVNATEGTAGAHCLYVNASDVFGNCNASVCIPLEVTEGGLIDRYDANDDDVISKDEAITAIMDYFDDKITKDEAIEVIMAYFG